MIPRILLIAVGVSGSTLALYAQTISVSCPEFFQDRHEAVSCTEALFSQSGYHFTLASLPPSNGFGPGLVLTKSLVPSALNVSLTGAITTNGSWFTGGDLQWVPPLPYKADTGVAGGQQLGKLKSLSRATIDVSVWHRSVKTLYYYGSGPTSPNTPYLFGEDDTSFDVSAQLPLTRWLVAKGEVDVRSITLRSGSNPLYVGNNFSTASTPGLSGQPLYLHSSVGAETLFTPRIGRPLQKLSPQEDPHFQNYLPLTLSNNFAFHWQTPVDGSPYAFRQFTYDGDQTIAVQRVLRNFFPGNRHRIIRYICNSNKQTDECDFGQFDVKTRLVLTQTSDGNQMPFYLQPTLGGTDIDSRMTLRGWDNYRFRGRDLALVQFEYGIPVYDPIGTFFFYDAGTVGNSLSDLAVTRFRQDGGLGLSVRLRGHVLAQTFYAFGAGHGGQWNYNFSKVF